MCNIIFRIKGLELKIWGGAVWLLVGALFMLVSAILQAI
jgi:hypothetical protein